VPRLLLAEAQYNLGNMHVNGKGVLKDAKQAVYWYKKAAEQGYAGAQYNLGFMYVNGKGVLKDDKQAVYWYTPSPKLYITPRLDCAFACP
jgi:TPR repeat protein